MPPLWVILVLAQSLLMARWLGKEHYRNKANHRIGVLVLGGKCHSTCVMLKEPRTHLSLPKEANLRSRNHLGSIQKWL